MKKEKVSKSEKVLKILKIVGSAIGLTLCSAGFIFLLVVGVRGCTASSNHNNDYEESLQQEVINNDEPQARAMNTGSEYIYCIPFDNDYTGRMTQLFNDVQQQASSLYTGQQCDFTYNGDTVRASVLQVTIVTYTGGGYSQEMFILNFRRSSDNSRVLYLSYGWDDSEDKLYLQELYSDVWGWSYVDDNVNNDVMPNLFDLSCNITYVGEVNLRYYVSYWVDTFFVKESTMLNEPVYVSLNNVINPYGPIGASFDYFTTMDLSGTYTLLTGLFTDSEGTYYKAIQLTYLSAYGMRYGTTESYNVYDGLGSHYMTMSYITLDNKMVVVNAQSYGVATAGSDVNNTVMLKGNHWISTVYQYLTFYQINENSNSDGFSGNKTRLAALTSLNNNSDFSGVTGSGGGSVGTLGIFTLIGTAFQSIVPIFNTQILPGVNIWTLLVIPLVGMIVIFIVWLFKR